MLKHKFGQSIFYSGALLLSTVAIVTCSVQSQRPADKACEEFENDDNFKQVQEYAFMAKLFHNEENINWTFRCDGALIGKKWVITPARCDSFNPMRVTLGSPTIHQTQTLNVNKFHKRPEHSRFQNDIAVLELESEIDYTKDVFPICLNTKVIDSPGNYTVFGTPYRSGKIEEFLNVTILIEPTSTCVSIKHKGGLCGHSSGEAWDTYSGSSLISIENDKSSGKRKQLLVGIQVAGTSGSRLTYFSDIVYFLEMIENIVWPTNE